MKIRSDDSDKCRDRIRNRERERERDQITRCNNSHKYFLLLRGIKKELFHIERAIDVINNASTNGSESYARSKVKRLHRDGKIHTRTSQKPWEVDC